VNLWESSTSISFPSSSKPSTSSRSRGLSPMNLLSIPTMSRQVKRGSAPEGQNGLPTSELVRCSSKRKFRLQAHPKHACGKRGYSLTRTHTVGTRVSNRCLACIPYDPEICVDPIFPFSASVDVVRYLHHGKHMLSRAVSGLPHHLFISLSVALMSLLLLLSYCLNELSPRGGSWRGCGVPPVAG